MVVTIDMIAKLNSMTQEMLHLAKQEQWEQVIILIPKRQTLFKQFQISLTKLNQNPDLSRQKNSKLVDVLQDFSAHNRQLAAICNKRHKHLADKLQAFNQAKKVHEIYQGIDLKLP